MPLKKIGRAIKRTVRKVVPKEVAGIMTAAAPFVAPYSLPAAAALSIGGQLRTGRGRINPLTTALSLLPGVRFQGGQGIGAFRPTGFTRFGDANFGSGITARELLFGGPQATGKLGAFGDKAEGFLFGTPGVEASNLDKFAVEAVDPKQGLLGFGGKFGTGGSLISTMKDGAPVISKTKVGAAVAAGLSLTQTQEQIEEEGQDAGLSSSEIARLQQEAAEMWEDFDTTAFRPKVAQGGLMRINRSEGTPDPLTPAGIGSLASKKEPPRIIEYYPEDDSRRRKDAFLEVMDEDGNRFTIDLEEYIEKYGQPKLSRKNLALGSRPTEQESGLGGLPIEADMRYTGGFMPYGAKEKADDVPARLSKNEFVFTADAVRGAGGGDINTGAKRMYQSMKQLEQMGKRA